jgi:hypothetical protein
MEQKAKKKTGTKLNKPLRRSDHFLCVSFSRILDNEPGTLSPLLTNCQKLGRADLTNCLQLFYDLINRNDLSARFPAITLLRLWFYVYSALSAYCANRGCQMLYLQTKNPNLGKVGIFFGHLDYISAILYILRPFCNLVVIWYISPSFGILCQEKSGSPGANRRFKIQFSILQSASRQLSKCVDEKKLYVCSTLKLFLVVHTNL